MNYVRDLTPGTAFYFEPSYWHMKMWEDVNTFYIEEPVTGIWMVLANTCIQDNWGCDVFVISPTGRMGTLKIDRGSAVNTFLKVLQ